MLIESLRLKDFRNVEEAFFEPHHRFNVFCGANGHGKTNTLEAIFLLSAVKSFRPQVTRDLIRFDTDIATLEAKVDRGGHERVVRIDVTERGKKVFLNNTPVRNLSDFFGTINVVVFGPEDVTLLKGSPAARRRFLDRAIFNAQATYAYISQQYDDIVKQRNALLKLGTFDPILMETYDEQFVQAGTEIVVRRLAFLEKFRPVLTSVFSQIFDASFSTELKYVANWSPTDLQECNADTISDILETSLKATAYEERERKHTRVGPHRDDICAFLNGREIKQFGSQGQHRAYVLAMKIAEITYLEEKFRFAPILLLDDVSSELDRERNRFLFSFLRERMEGQVFITTTHRDHILLDDDISVYDVTSGAISER